VTVSVTNSVSNRPWRGYDDPGLPVGMWVGQNAVTGDGSGGDMIVFMDFKAEGEPISGRQWNLEQINIFHSDTTTRVGHVVLNNFEILGPVGLVNRQWRFEIEDNADNVAALTNQIYLPLPLFLGQAEIPDFPCQLEVGINNINMTSLVVTAQGYIWEARSVQAEGGLRRPVDSLYGGGGR